MSYLGSWKIDDLLTFYANTTRFDTGNATDADAVPAYRVYEDETGTAILTGNMALLDSANTAGFYSEQITLSAANGFEKGKSYAIYIAATVNSVAGATHHTLQIEAEVDANRINWANVDNPSTAVNLSATNIDVDQVVASVSGAVGSVTAGVTVTTNNDKTGYALSAAAIQAIWDALTSALTTVGSIGKLLVDNINATISSRSSHSAADVWAVATRLLTAGTNIVLAKGVGVTGFNDLSAAQVNTEADTAIADARLDELLAADSDIDGAAPPTVGSVFHELLTKTAGSFTYDQTTDSVEAIRDRGDAAWITATGFSTLTQADVRTAVGLASANLDTQLTTIDDFLDTEVLAIKAQTDLFTFTGNDVKATLDGETVTVGTNNDKAGYALSAAGVDAILDDAITEPASVFAWGTATLRNIISWLGALSSNEIRQTAALQTLRNRADSSTIASAAVADDGTTATRDSFT